MMTVNRAELEKRKQGAKKKKMKEADDKNGGSQHGRVGKAEKNWRK